jgi:hypothetical protein
VVDVALPNTPRFIYNSITLEPTLPARPWISGLQAVGAGSEVSAAGIPSAWVTRWEYPFRIPLRFLENEWPEVRSMIEYGMRGNTIQVFPDTAVATSYVCYLVSPAMGERAEPIRGEFLSQMEITLEFRRTTTAAIDTEFFGG